jgi:hypothetical protein
MTTEVDYDLLGELLLFFHLYKKVYMDRKLGDRLTLEDTSLVMSHVVRLEKKYPILNVTHQ